MIKKIIFVSIIASMFVLNACKKSQVDNQTQAAKDLAISQNAILKIFPIVNNILYTDSGLAAGSFSNDTIINDSVSYCSAIEDVSSASTYPFSFALNFGNGCSDNSMSTFFSGILDVQINAPFDTVGSEMIIHFSDFYVNEFSISGKLTVKNEGNGKYDVTFENGVLKGDNATLKYGSNGEYSRIGGGGTYGILSDDVWKITSSGNGTDRLNVPYKFSNKEPLVENMNCKNIDKGVEDIAISGRDTRTLDYGNGGCDNTAKVIIDGNEFDFSLN